MVSTYTCLEILQASAKIRKFWRRDKDDVEFLHYDARKLEVLE